MERRIKKASLAALLAGLPVLAHGQQPTQVPAILQPNAAAAASAMGGPGPAPSDHPAASASAMAAAGAGAPNAVGAAGMAGAAGSGDAAPGGATPAGAGALPAGMPPSINVLSPSAPLNAKEKQAVALARRWAGAAYMPHADADGVIRFHYGATLPTVVCAPLQVCDLALQPGEVVNNINLGDKVRWNVLPGVSGSPNGQVTHLIVKATDAGLMSSMTVLTDRRTYSIKLVSTRAQWMPMMAFSYPDEMQNQWAAYRATVGHGGGGGGFGTVGFSGADANPGNLDFGFRLTGDHPSWLPLRAYSDGAKTYIQFPRPVAFGAAPTLVGLANDGGWFSSPSKQVVNYRIIGDRYVVDRVLDRAELISGVGDGQERVRITHEGAR